MQEQVRLSNLVFPDTNKDEMPQWKSDSWPPLLGGWRCNHASVVVNGEKKGKQTVVVIGGQKAKCIVTNSVLLMDLEKDKKEWREGESMNQNRGGHSAVVCNGSVYALGGYSTTGSLKSIERIDLVDLLKSPCTTNNKKHWMILNCTLSTPRSGCQAAVVHNRFLVVAGGYNGCYLSSTDIIDTAVQAQHSVIAGPSMTVSRAFCGMAVVGHRIFVVGGYNRRSNFNSVEYLDFIADSEENKEDLSCIFPSSSKWKVHKDMVLSVPRHGHAVAKVGTCLIVTGGEYDIDGSTRSVEVLDTKRNVTFKLPDMAVGRSGPSVVSFPDGIAVIGGGRHTCETLSLTNMPEHTKRDIKNMYSCRAQIDMQIEKLNGKIQLASKDRSKLKALQEAIEAESLLPVMEWLRDHDDKFRSVQELEETIEGLKRKLDDIDGFVNCLPIVRKIDELENLVMLNQSFGDKEILACQKEEAEFKPGSVTGNETLPVSIRTTDELWNAYDGSEERFMKLEDMMIEQRNMMVQLSDRVRLLEKKRTRSIS